MKLKHFLAVTYPIEFTKEKYLVMDDVLSNDLNRDVEIESKYDNDMVSGRKRMEWFERNYGECLIDNIGIYDNHILIWLTYPH